MFKKILFFVSLCLSFLVNAQTLHWIGGSGYWGDTNHWSLTSGGKPAMLLPSEKNDVVFDNLSGTKSFTVHALQSFFTKKLTTTNTRCKIEIIGSPNVDLITTGDVQLNTNFALKHNGKIYLNPTTASSYNFSNNKLNSDVVVNSNHVIDLGVLETTKSIVFNGSLTLNNSTLFTEKLDFKSGSITLINSNLQAQVITKSVFYQLNASSQNPSSVTSNFYSFSAELKNVFNSTSGLKVFQISACPPISVIGENPLCDNTVCNGKITVDLTGCPSGPFNIIVPAKPICGYPGFTLNAVAAGVYTITNVCGCNTSYAVNVINSLGSNIGKPASVVWPNPSEIEYQIIPPSCFGMCDGMVIATARNLTAVPVQLFFSSGPPTLTLNLIDVPDTLKGLCAGVLDVTITNANGCTEFTTVAVTEPLPLTLSGTTQSITCNGVCNGVATVTAAGGNLGYTYSWTPAQASNTITTVNTLCPGSFTVKVTDTKSCTATFSNTITQPPPITTTVTQTDLKCFNICNGSATITPAGGKGPYTYTLLPVTPGATITTSSTKGIVSGLCSGNYTVNLTDAQNCPKQVTFTITSPPLLTATTTQTNVTCNGLCNATISVAATGGTIFTAPAPAYTYTYSSPITSTASIASGVCVGVYSFTVTDKNSCTFTNTVNITQPPPIGIVLSKSDLKCNAVCDGTASAIASGGNGSYTYTWSPGNPTGQGTSSVSGLCAGNYSLTIGDGSGCNKNTTFTITQPPAIIITSTSTNIPCNGSCTGSISVSVSGGTAPVTFSLVTSTSTLTSGSPFTGLCAGTYTIMASDLVNCIKTKTVVITQPNALTLALNTTSLNCSNACNGSISSVVGGGTPSYTVSWVSSTGAIIPNGLIASNLCAGTYTATLKDANNCTITAVTNLIAPPQLTVNISATPPNCFGQCNGIATTTISGGTPNYTVTWSNGPIGTVDPNLCAGTYTASVKDSKGCIAQQTISIIAPPALTLTTTNGTMSCSGVCDGTVGVTATGGTPIYNYSWNGGSTPTNSITGSLCQGNYIVNVTDSKGCLASKGASVTQPPVLTATITNVVPSCNVCIGSATGAGIGGTPAYTYSWSPSGQTTPTATSLCVGPQTLTVTDSKGCTKTQTVNITQAVTIIVTANSNTLACNGVCSGVATANASGGLPLYTYSWSPAPTQTTQTASNLCAGTHTVEVIDSQGCHNQDVVTFVNPPAITLTIVPNNVTCNGLCNGSVTANGSGGTGSITYTWMPGNITGSSLNNICAGDYTVNASDGNGCVTSQVVTITEQPAITATVVSVNPTTCLSADASISFTLAGGTPAYTHVWNVGGSANPLINLTDGVYTFTVTDFKGCKQIFSTTISDPAGPTVTATSTSVTCFGLCNGSATLSISGVVPFSTSWPAPISSTNTTVSNLCAGVFVPQVTDGNGCVTNQTISIAESSQYTVTGVASNVSCNAACNGSVNLTVLGGTPGYNYTWLPAGNGEDPTGLCASDYTVNIIDANSCPVSTTFAIIQPSSLTVTFNKKDLSCNGVCNGAVGVDVVGGSGPYTYIWSPLGSFPGSVLDTIINLCKGIYTVQVKDAGNCVITETISIDEPTALTSNVVVKNATCAGQCNGIATTIANGGTLPYTYSSVGSTSVTAGLCFGVYNSIVTDFNGCTNNNVFTITQPLPLTVTATPTNPKCNNSCDGSVATTVAGGNPSYHFNWIPSGGIVQNPTNLCAGNYTCVVTDDSLCTTQALVTLTNPLALLANITFTNPSCNSSCDGQATANPVNAQGAVTYSWTSPLQTAQIATGLCPSPTNYSLQITDNNGCVATQTITLVAPSPLNVNPAITPATCGFSDGTIDASNVSGGNAPYTYNWLPPVLAAQSTNTVVTGLAAGLYTVTVTDVTNCSATVVVPVSNSNGPSGATITTTDVACFGQCNGAATISNPVGGTPGYTLSWAIPFNPSSSISSLCAGGYSAQIKDANSCLLFIPVTINEPQLIDDNEIITSATCFGICNGSITLAPTGGNGGYNFAWSNGAANSATVTNLCPGPITTTITDSKNCSFTATYNTPSLISITSNTFVTDNKCFGDCNGNALATNVAGGLPPYSFSWNDPINQSTASAINLCNGNYSVTVKDANGCFNQFATSIVSPTQLSLATNVTQQPSCGLCNGAAIATPSGGTPSYTLNWSNGASGASGVNLCAGIYQISTKDGNGCVSNASVTINSSSSITGESITKTDVTCAGLCNGNITISAIGGVAPISYFWPHNGSTAQVLNGVCAGTYFCNMQDATGCIRTASVVIGNAVSLTLTPTIAQTSCSSNTGSISVVATGGTNSFTFVWNPAAGNVTSLTNLGAGNYSLTVTDGNGCATSDIYNINSINGPQVTSTITNITCGGLTNGAIDLTISGGTPSYTTNWSNGAGTDDISGLTSGAYTYTITDAAGCKAVDNFSISTPTPLLFSAPNFNSPSCNNICDGSITALPFGGTLAYTFSWTPGNSSTSTATNLCVGNYSITVTDGKNCVTTKTYSLSGPLPIAITATLTDVVCNSQTNGAIDATVIGGTPTFTYSWSNGATTEDINNLAAGPYTLTVTDGGNCVQDSVFNIIEPLVLTITNTIVSAQCFGNCNGSISTTPVGGNGAYTFTWSPIVAATSSVTSLCPGDYTVTVADLKGCSTTTNYNVPSIVTITTAITATNNLCYNNCTGVLEATNVSGGSGGYTFTWPSLGQSGATASNVCNGTHSVTITDSNGCFNKWPGIITSPTQVTVTPTTTDPSCGMCNGSSTLALSGGIPNYNVVWALPNTGTVATNLCAGVYAISITDANACVTNTNIIINSSSGITGETITSTDEICAGQCNGTVTITAIGGAGAISYNWLHGPTTQTLSGLCAGTYFCNMTDANNCTRSASVVIGAATTLTVDAQVFQTSCVANTGSIIVNASGGQTPYTYNWLPVASGTVITNLAPGIYTLNVSDNNGCSQQNTYALNSINAPVLTSTITNESCVAKCDGKIDLTITGGNPSYTTTWSNGTSAIPLTNLCVGTYSVKVVDVAGCTAVNSFSITTNTAIVFNTPTTSNPKCFNDCNGTINALPLGGQIPYTVVWNPVQTPSLSLQGLCANDYTLQVSDVNGCVATQSYTLINPSPLTFSAVVTNASCSSVADGAIDMTINGGVPVYTYSWSNTATSEDLTNVLSGPYTFTVTDAGGCSKDTTLQINATVVVIAVAGNDTTFCQNGSIVLNGNNSVGGITYQWLELPLNTVVSNTLTANVTPPVGTSTYVLVATNGLCVDVDTIKVNSNALPSVDAGVTVYIPLTGTTVIGGNPTSATATSFTWSPSFSLSNDTIANPTSSTTITTIYTVSVVDANGCRNSDTMTVNVFPNIIFPNGFSPNADGKNDTWVIDFINLFPDNVVEVYNRWGELLFTSKGYPIPWNGQYKGKDLPVGTYYYIINLNHPLYPDAFTGPLTIFR